MIAILRVIGLAGLLVFGAALVLILLSPIAVERAARGFVEAEIEQGLREQLAGLEESRRAGTIGRLAQDMANLHDSEADALREQLSSGLNAKVAAHVARMLNADCECRKAIAAHLDAIATRRLSDLQQARPRLTRIIEGHYARIVGELLRDLTIFSATNLAAFALLFGITFLKAANVRQLFVPGLLLVAASLCASLIYMLGHDWFFTLIYGDFVGFAYLVWLAFIYAWLPDIALFKARGTQFVMASVGTAFSSAGC